MYSYKNYSSLELVKLAIKTNLAGRIKNTKDLSAQQCLMPLFEAVVNSIHAIEERFKEINDGTITIEILRINQKENFSSNDIDETPLEIIGFKIIDNGIGFHDKNMESFEILDTDYKSNKGCKGIGRIQWLKVFQQVRIDSKYQQDGNAMPSCRAFIFNIIDEVVPLNSETCNFQGNCGSCVHLDGVLPLYKQTISKKSVKKIAQELLDHCLWYFVRQEGAPLMILYDGDDCVKINDLFVEHVLGTPETESFTLKKEQFELTHIKLHEVSDASPKLALNGNGRLVQEIGLAKQISGLRGPLIENDVSFSYIACLSAPYLDQHVSQERVEFTIPQHEETEDDLFPAPSLEEIENKSVSCIRQYLGKYISQNLASGKERIISYTNNKAPRYKPILVRIPEEKFYVDPNAPDYEVENLLHKIWYEMDREVLDESEKIFVPLPKETPEEHKLRIDKYYLKLSDLTASDLAAYVCHRHEVLRLFENLLSLQDNGKYSLEKEIHELIMPMGKTSDEIHYGRQNLWLIDERLVFHDYLASDKKISSMPITSSEDLSEPDICVMQLFDRPWIVTDKNDTLASLTIIEFKKPMRSNIPLNENDNPIQQVLKYLAAIREQKMLYSSKGRPITNVPDIPGYCYIICDLDEKLYRFFEKENDFTPAPDHEGFFRYYKNLKAYVEVISYNKLLKAARERNSVFFRRLGLIDDIK